MYKLIHAFRVEFDSIYSNFKKPCTPWPRKFSARNLPNEMLAKVQQDTCARISVGDWFEILCYNHIMKHVVTYKEWGGFIYAYKDTILKHKILKWIFKWGIIYVCVYDIYKYVVREKERGRNLNFFFLKESKKIVSMVT